MVDARTSKCRQREDWQLDRKGSREAPRQAAGVATPVTDYLGADIAAHNQLATCDAGGNVWLIGAGSSAGVFRYRAVLSDTIFADGFDG
jgi:hypothetical protein